MYETLVGEHIVLRKAKEKDALSMLKHVWGDEEVYRWMLYQPTLTEPDAEERCRRSIQFQKDHLAWFVALKDTDEAMELVFIRLGAEDVRYGYFQDNIKSKMVAEHFGFVYDHTEEMVRPWDGSPKKIDSCLLTRDRYLAR